MVDWPGRRADQCSSSTRYNITSDSLSSLEGLMKYESYDPSKEEGKAFLVIVLVILAVVLFFSILEGLARRGDICPVRHGPAVSSESIPPKRGSSSRIR